jgi:hypothetical protein
MANQDTEITLYNGRHTAIFKNSTHRYLIDGQLKPGVTTIMSKVLAKPGLVLWPLNMALAELKTKLPTLTQADLDEAAKAHVKKRDAGADTGTIVHELVEKVLLGILPMYDSHPPEVEAALSAFMAWTTAIAPSTVAVEQVVYSEKYDYCGTFDSILAIDGKNYLCDLKTTNASREAPEGIYADYFIQLGAYLEAYTEQRLFEMKYFGKTELVPIHDVMVISCKKNGKVHTKTGHEVGLTTAACRSLWKATLLLYRTQDKTKKRLGAVHG